MGVDDSMVTCARTRGSMMKFLPVAALTASAIIVMSASLKFGVIFCWFGCCAKTGAPANSHATAQAQVHARACLRLVAINPEHFISRFPRRAGPPVLCLFNPHV